MGLQDFVTGFLRPAAWELAPCYLHRPPRVPGLEQVGSCIVQGEQGTSFSTSVIHRHQSRQASVSLVDVYKNTENKVSGRFVRLLGTMALRQKDRPLVFVDAAVTNVNPHTGEDEALTTRVVVHHPQAEPSRRQRLYDSLSAMADSLGVPAKAASGKAFPDFWGEIWLMKVEGLQMEAIAAARDQVWAVTNDSDESGLNAFCDTREVREFLIFEQAQAEHELFAKMGLEVPLGVQSAFFSAFCSL